MEYMDYLSLCSCCEIPLGMKKQLPLMSRTEEEIRDLNATFALTEMMR